MQPNLDLLRAVAVLFVLVSHTITVVTGKMTLDLHRWGQLGVVLFFVHTALVLMQSLERQQLTGSTMFKRFYVQRIFRIYPLAIVFITSIFILGSKQWTPFAMFSNLTLTQNLFYVGYASGVLWSLPLEVQMYICLPILYIFFRNRPVSWLLVLWVLSVPVAYAVPFISGRINMLEFVPCFLGGVIAWRMQGHEKLPGWAWPPLLAVCCIAFFYLADPWNNDYGRWVVCLVVGLIIPQVRQLKQASLNAFSKTVAKYSYGIYLFHYPLLEFAFETLADRPYAVQWGVFLISVTGIPFVAYHLIEHPMIKLGHAWTERKGTAKVVAPAA
ncbi:acyltransferase family protein [Pseudoduganella sp. UC29_106]|uniref:acyltransferase family protein n=1 Tax=Pseudoduganella sp. UC29_106 TaxID=3374553 RepID=UPI003757C4AE